MTTISTMSIDVFGRQFKGAEIISQGPPGIGFKITLDGHFNIENKKLCNVGEAENQNDAINLSLMQRVLTQECSEIYNVIASLRTEVVNNNMMIQAQESSADRFRQQFKKDLKAIEELVYRNVELISQLDSKLNALQNG